MAKVQKHKTDGSKRFGARYGRRLKERVSAIEAGHRGRQKSPITGKKSVKRVAAGIWLDTKTGTKFTGKAYSMRGE